MVYLIPFTQYSLPDGRRSTLHYECADEEIYELSNQFRLAGGYYEIEVLRNGALHMDAWMPAFSTDEPLTLQVCANQPVEVEATTNKLIRDAHQLWKGQIDARDQ